MNATIWQFFGPTEPIFWIVDVPGGGGGVPSSPGGGVIVLDLREGLIGGVLGPLGGGGALLSILWGWGDASL